MSNNTENTIKINTDASNDDIITKYCGNPISDNEASIRTENLSKRIDGRHIVNNMNFRIRRGSMFAMLGPNGAGKTTTTRLITGMLHPSDGHVYIDNIEMNDQTGSYLRSYMGVQVDGNSYHDMTVIENLDLWAEIYNLDRQTKRTKIDTLLDGFTLTQYADMNVSELSKGNRQKVQIARALLIEPKFIFLDEPTSGIDPQSSTLLMKSLRDLCEQHGSTVFLNTHRLQGLDGIVNNIGVMEDGSLIEYGDVNMMIHERWPITEYELIITPDSMNGINNANITTRNDISRLVEAYATTRMPQHDYVINNGNLQYSFILSLKNMVKPEEIVRTLVNANVGIYEFRRIRKTIQDLYLDKVKAGEWEDAE